MFVFRSSIWELNNSRIGIKSDILGLVDYWSTLDLERIIESLTNCITNFFLSKIIIIKKGSFGLYFQNNRILSIRNDTTFIIYIVKVYKILFFFHILSIQIFNIKSIFNTFSIYFEIIDFYQFILCINIKPILEKSLYLPQNVIFKIYSQIYLKIINLQFMISSLKALSTHTRWTFVSLIDHFFNIILKRIWFCSQKTKKNKNLNHKLLKKYLNFYKWTNQRSVT